MSRNGSGNYTLPAGNPVVTGTTISSTWANNTLGDMASALTTSIASDGQTPITANLPMSGYKHTNVSDATERNQYSAVGQVQDGSFVWCGIAGGTANGITLTPSPAITAYKAGQAFRFKSSADNTGATTVAISGLTAIAVQVNGAACTGGEIVSGRVYQIVLDSTSTAQLQVTLIPVVQINSKIQPISASVASNALTLTLNPTQLDFRSTTLTSGTVNTRTISSAISLVVPTSATLGTVSGQSARLVLIAIDNAGTVELAVSNMAGGVNLDETTLISTTGISASSTSSVVIYSTTARSNVPFRVVGFIDITEATAGTWATAPTKVQGMGGQAITSLESFGFGQSLIDRTGSRTNLTIYYNTTGRPREVVVAGTNATTSTTLSVSINGAADVNFARCDIPSGAAVACGKFTVPPGASYRVSGATSSINFWSEFG